MIRCYWGGLGQGKTASMVEDLRQSFKRKPFQTATDMKSLQIPGQMYLDIESPELMSKFREGVIVMDEAQIAMGSRDWAKVPKETRSALAQLRKNGLDMYCTTQHPNRVDTVLREIVSQWVRVRRVGQFIFMRTSSTPNDKQGQWTVRRLRQKSLELYNSWEVLGTQDTKYQGAEWLRRAADRREAPRRSKAQPVRIWNRCENGSFMAPSALHVLRWLRTSVWDAEAVSEVVMTMDGPEEPLWQRILKEEVRRFWWLQDFGLGLDDVPTYVRREHPWHLGHCPCPGCVFSSEQYLRSVYGPWVKGAVVRPHSAKPLTHGPDTDTLGISLERALDGLGFH